jgi:NAD(P)-dependent dehydrogenase (short-subunit alcohol dehydrogenase family)
MAVVDEEAAPRIPKTIRYQRAPFKRASTSGCIKRENARPSQLPTPNQIMAEGASADQVHTESADMRDAHAALQALDRAEARFGPVQVLVNSAGAAGAVRRAHPADLT